MVVSSCYDPSFPSAITSIQFNKSWTVISRGAYEGAATTELLLFLRPNIAVQDVEMLEFACLPHESDIKSYQVDFIHNRSFDEEGTLKVLVIISPNEELPELLTFTVQAKVVERGPGDRIFMDWCQVDVFSELGDDEYRPFALGLDE